jgi:thioester reductase-like protein
VTGATGSLEAHIVSQLVALPKVKMVYCLVRAKSPERAHSRVKSSLASRQLLSSEFAAKVTCLPSDLSLENLGLDEKTLQKLRSSLTSIIHSAWAVNFNLDVRSFERSNIAGAYHLLKLGLSVSLSSPAKFFFISSVSAAAGAPLPAVIEECFVENFDQAQNMGYARSKLVTEHIVRTASLATNMHARVIRCGQLMGDSHNGIWNPTEAIPLMIQSAVTIGALPTIDEVCSCQLPGLQPTDETNSLQTPSWLPVDKCASAILELSGISAQQDSSIPPVGASTVYHVQNPTLFSWTNDLLPALLKAGLQFESVPLRAWIQRLRNGEQDPMKNPTVKLLEFFAEKYDHDGMGRNGLVFSTLRTSQASPTVRSGFDVIGSDVLVKCLEYWRLRWNDGRCNNN